MQPGWQTNLRHPRWRGRLRGPAPRAPCLRVAELGSLLGGSPPASSEWTRVIAWIPTFARPAALLGPDVSVASYKLRERPDGTACS